MSFVLQCQKKFSPHKFSNKKLEKTTLAENTYINKYKRAFRIDLFLILRPKMSDIKRILGLYSVTSALRRIVYDDDEEDDDDEDDEKVSLFASHTDMIFSRELEQLLNQAKKVQKPQDQGDHAVELSKVYAVNNKNKIEAQIPTVIDRWDILDQLHRYHQTQTNLSVLKSAHVFGLFLKNMNCARDLAHLEQLVTQLPLVPYRNLPAADSHLMLTAYGAESPGIRVPHAQGFTITDWNIIEHADGTNLFLARKKFRTHDFDGLRADLLLNVQFEVQGLAELDVQAEFHTDLYEEQLKFQRQGTQLVCQLSQPIWKHHPLRARIHLELGLTLPRGQHPPPIFVICRQERVYLKLDCSKLLVTCLKRFWIQNEEGVIEIGFRHNEVKSAEVVRVRPIVREYVVDD